MTGATSNWVGSPTGGGIDFDGTNDYVNVGSGRGLDLSVTGTICYWIKLPTTPTAFGTVIAKRTAGNAPGYNYDVDTAAGGNKIRGLISNGSSNLIITSTTSMVSNKWYHHAFTWDGKFLNVYLNGVKDATSVAQTHNAQINTKPLEIGRGADASPFYMNVQLDIMRVQNIALSEPEIKQLYSQPNIGIQSPTYYTPS